MPVVQSEMILLERITGPGTSLVLPVMIPREEGALVPTTEKPSIITLAEPFSEKPKVPPVTMDSATRVPFPGVPALAP